MLNGVHRGEAGQRGHRAEDFLADDAHVRGGGLEQGRRDKEPVVATPGAARAGGGAFLARRVDVGHHSVQVLLGGQGQAASVEAPETHTR